MTSTRQRKASITRQRNAAIKARVHRVWCLEKLADLSRRLDALTGFKKLAKIEALAADDRGNANVRAVATAKAKEVHAGIDTARQTLKPTMPSFDLPRTSAEWDALKQKASAERKAKRAAAKMTKGSVPVKPPAPAPQPGK